VEKEMEKVMLDSRNYLINLRKLASSGHPYLSHSIDEIDGWDSSSEYFYDACRDRFFQIRGVLMAYFEMEIISQPQLFELEHELDAYFEALFNDSSG